MKKLPKGTKTNEDSVPLLTLANANIDDICEMIIEGRTYRDIAHHYNAKLTTFFRFLYLPEHSTHTQQAREFAAHVLVDNAELVLAQAKDNPALLQVAALLAHHYRWKASLLNRRDFGQRIKEIEVEKEGTTKEIIVKVIEE
jgi:hypothetical protein